jgi:hypothetical protein
MLERNRAEIRGGIEKVGNSGNKAASVRIARRTLEGGDLPEIVEMLNQYPNIVGLDLAGNHFTGHDGGAALANLKYVKKIILNDCPELNDDFVLGLLYGKPSGIETLDLSRTKVGNASAAVISFNSRVRELKLDGVLITPPYKKLLADKVKSRDQDNPR